MNGNWNIRKKELSKFFKLKNGQWLKIIFTYNKYPNIWFMTICVANSKRQCNDCVRKTEFSPKILYGKKTGHNTSIEPFLISLKELLLFETKVEDCEIRIIGANDKLSRIYSRLKRYGYETQLVTYSNGVKKLQYYKKI